MTISKSCIPPSAAIVATPRCLGRRVNLEPDLAALGTSAHANGADEGIGHARHDAASGAALGFEG